MTAPGVVVWFTGLPASGKSTLAERVGARLTRPSVILDGDVLRAVLEIDGYEFAERERFYRVLANLAATLARQALVVLVAATAPRQVQRARARALTGRFIEVWVRTSLPDCRRRDAKGLYARADAGELATLPGVGIPYEPPGQAEVTAHSGFDDDAVHAICRLVDGAR